MEDAAPQPAEEPAAAAFPGGGFVLAATLLAAALRLYGLTAQSLWVDEVLTWKLVRPEAGLVLFEQLRDNIQGPLHLAVLWPLLRLADTEFMLRLPSAVAGILTIPVFARVAADLAGGRSARLAILLLASTYLGHLEVISRMIAPGHASYEGERVHVIDAINEPRSIQEKIPLIVGGNGRKRTAGLAVKFADEYTTNPRSFPTRAASSSPDRPAASRRRPKTTRAGQPVADASVAVSTSGDRNRPGFSGDPAPANTSWSWSARGSDRDLCRFRLALPPR